MGGGVMERYRYKISGILTTKSPLHIGSGQEIEKTVNDENNKEKNVKIQSVVTDKKGKPFIPASALKGSLGDLARIIKEQEPDLSDIIKALFGAKGPDNEEDKGQGGAVLFQDARIDEQASSLPPLFNNREAHEQNAKIPLYWNPQRYTYIITGNALDRVTRTVSKHKLYFKEVVPSGTSFKVNILCDGISKDELNFLLNLLDKFDGTASGMRLGAETAHGFGKIKWNNKPDRPSVTGLISQNNIETWLNQSHSPFEGFPDLSANYFKPDKANKIDTQNIVSQIKLYPNTLIFRLKISFDGAFMINDPSQAYEGSGGESLNHVYLKDESGKVVLKSRSLHGALRTQAERIVRTIAPEKLRLEKACYPVSKDSSCRPEFPAHELLIFKNNQYICLTCRLFGCKGWRSPVSISDFTIVSTEQSGQELNQEFVAIDRFTGGAAEGQKFRARYVYQPVLEGEIRIDLDRIDLPHAGLLVFLMRDLIEGDIFPGFGKSKGFGRCTAKILKIIPPEEWPKWINSSVQSVRELTGDESELADHMNLLRENNNQNIFNETEQYFLGSLLDALMGELEQSTKGDK